jgi:hypothetical protein
VVHTDNIKHRYIQSTSPFTTTRRQQELPSLKKKKKNSERYIHTKKISVVGGGVFQLLLKTLTKSKNAA